MLCNIMAEVVQNSGNGDLTFRAGVVQYHGIGNSYYGNGRFKILRASPNIAITLHDHT